MNTQQTQQTSGLWQDLTDLPGRYWVLFSGTLVNRFGHFVVPFLALYLRQAGHGTWVTGLVLASYGAGALGAGAIGGYLADRMGRKATLVFSSFAASVAMLLLSQARSVPALVVMTFATGLASAMYFPAASALLADMVPPRLRVRAFSCQRLAVNLGFAAGTATAGLVAQYSFVALFVVDAVTTAVLGLVVLFGLPAGVRVARERASWGPALRHVRGNPLFLRAVLASFLVAVVLWQMSSSYGLQVTEGAGLSESAFGLLMALNGIMIVLFELPLTSWTRRLPPRRVMAAGFVLVGIGLLINALGAGLMVLAASMVVFTVGEMISLPVTNSYIAELAPEEMRGRYMGMLSVAWSSATMVGPAAGVALFRADPNLVWFGTFGMGVLAAAVILPSGARASRPVAEPELVVPGDG